MNKITEEQVFELEDKLMRAMQNQDVRELDQLLNDNLLFAIPNGETITKSMDMEGYKSGQMVIEWQEASNHKLSIIEDTAVISVLIQMKGSFQNHSIDGKYRYIRVWKMVENQLQVIGGSCIFLP